jgi:hypothetical protein
MPTFTSTVPTVSFMTRTRESLKPTNVVSIARLSSFSSSILALICPIAPSSAF